MLKLLSLQVRNQGLHAALFAGTATIVGHRRDVLDHGDLQSDRLEGTDGPLTARPRALNAHFDFTHAVGHGLPRGVLSDLLRRIGGALARAFESDAPGAGPAN